jgi:hypothetical protein
MVLYSAVWAIGGYFALGAVVLASRFFFPKEKASRATETQAVEHESHELAKAA